MRAQHVAWIAVERLVDERHHVACAALFAGVRYATREHNRNVAQERSRNDHCVGGAGASEISGNVTNSTRRFFDRTVSRSLLPLADFTSISGRVSP